MESEVTFNEIKRLLKELAISQKETDIKFKETDAKFKNTDAKFIDTDKQIKRAFDLFEGQWGKLIESLVEGVLINLLNERGIKVHDTSMRRKGFYNGQQFEFDIIAHDGNAIVIVEVKTTLRVKHVKEFVEKLSHAKNMLHEYQNYSIYGAMAFLRAEEASDVLAAKEKLFVIKATGNSASITNTNDFVPKVF